MNERMKKLLRLAQEANKDRPAPPLRFPADEALYLHCERGVEVVLATDYDIIDAALDAAIEERDLAYGEVDALKAAFDDRVRVIELQIQDKDALAARIAELRRFAVGILDLCPHTECEGIQELAVNHGVLVEVTVTEPCGDNCECAEVSDFPLTCYRLAPEFADSAVKK